jgi:uncharacterized protein GlcG (DUF336 family)
MTLRSLASLSTLAVALAIPGLARAQRAPYGKPITLEQARKVLAAAEAEAKKVVTPLGVSIAVLDSTCSVVALERMDNTSLGTAPIAQDKAATACNFRLDTKGAQDRLAQGGGSLILLALRGFTPIEGGVQLIVGGEIVGAIGISGGSSQQDEQIARAGAAVLGR